MSRWHSASRSTRWAAAALAIVLFYGTAVHVFQLVGSGLSAYACLPAWLRTYFIALVVFDPLAAFLVVLRRRSGIALAVAVLTTDAVANGWANYVLDSDPGVTAGRVGHGVITVLAVSACAFAPHLWQATAPTSAR